MVRKSFPFAYQFLRVPQVLHPLKNYAILIAAAMPHPGDTNGESAKIIPVWLDDLQKEHEHDR